MHTLIMKILESGSASEEDADKIEELEELLQEQKCFEKAANTKHEFLGEEIATLFFEAKSAEAIDKMIASDITPEDFFGFVNYHYDDEHEDEELAEMFTDAFIRDIHTTYQSKII